MLTSQSQTDIALGSRTIFTIVCEEADAPKLDALFKKLWRETYRFERQFSRFLPASELSEFNGSAITRRKVSPEFRELLLAAHKYSELTGGLFNPFVLPALQRAGYKKSFVPGYENDPNDDHSDKTVVKSSSLKIGPDWAEIPYGTAIDLGGIGKGFLADKLAEQLPEWITGYWLSLGGDIAAGGRDQENKAWQVAVQDAANLEEDTDYSLVSAKPKFAVATSSTLTRKGVSGGRDWHHIIDPRSQQPTTTDVCQATVYSNSATTADILAKVAVIVGSSEAWRLIKDLGADGLYLQYEANGKIDTRIYGKDFQKTGA